MKIIINDLEVSPEEAIKLAQKEIEEYGKKKGLWRPKGGERYFYIAADGCIESSRYYSEWDKKTVESGNCFQTKELAQKELDKHKALVRIKDYIAREGIEKKYTPNINQINGILDYFYTRVDAEKISKAREADLKILFDV